MNTQQLEVKKGDFPVAETIFQQARASKVEGMPFLAMMGAKNYVMTEDTLILKGSNWSAHIIYDYGMDLYNLIIYKGKFPNNHVVKELKGIYCDQFAEIIYNTIFGGRY